MYLIIFLIYMCFDFGDVFPSSICDSRSKKLLFLLDCQGEMEEQTRLALDILHYFNTKTNVTGNTQYSRMTVVNGNYIWDVDDANWSKLKCNKSIPISEVMTISKEWQEQQARSISFVYLSIVFLKNITDTKSMQEYISKTVEGEKRFGKFCNRFFIIQTSENNSEDFTYHVTSFKDLDVNNVMLSICAIRTMHYSFSYSNNNYWTSTYFIVNDLFEMSNSDVLRYCRKEYYSLLPSLETSDEALYIFQFLMNVSVTRVTNRSILHLGLVRGEISTGLIWHSSNFFWHYNKFRNSKPKNCFYINLTSYAKDIQSLENKMYDFGTRIESIECDEKLPNSLVVCEYDNNSYTKDNKNIEHVIENLETSRINNYVLYGESFTLFMKIFVKFIDFQWDDSLLDYNYIMYGTHIDECSFGEKYPEGTLKSYVCTTGLIDKSDSGTNADTSESIVVAHNKNTPFYTLNTVDISQCNNYNECQKTLGKDTVNVNSNAHLNIYCLDEREHQISNVTCSAQELKFNFPLQYFPCETDSNHYFYKCIKDITGQCQDNSNLRNCENFTCPDTFFKCPNSYCVFPLKEYIIGCPFSEDKILYHRSMQSCQLIFYFVLKDICIDTVSFDTFSQPSNQSDFICDHTCPKNYRCVSSKIAKKDKEKTETKRVLKLYYSDILDSIAVPTPINNELNFPYYNLISIVELYKVDCWNVKFYEATLLSRIWKLTELLVLDLSKTNLTKSDKLWSLDHFTKLKKLNLSFNEGFELDENFTFPSLLEVIDLYGTKVHALRTDAFKTLIHLRYLNLSYTFITRFKDMGIPDYFSLNTLHLEGLQIQNIGIDLFRGLTIHSELWASDFAICCSQSLNTNISVDKCHAPVDVISSCEHLVGETLKRIVIWIVGLLTIIGNGIVIAYRLGWNREIFKKAYGHFITSLAVSDFLMGMYLVLIACVDIYYSDVYVFEDFLWRNSYLCRFAGFLSTLSSETSTFFICLITLDRFLSITYPFGEHRYSKTGRIISTATVWILGFVLALLPVFFADWEIYSSNGLCLALPFSSKQNKGWMFSFVVFVVLNFVLFLLTAFGQLAIFLNMMKIRKVIPDFNESRSNDWLVAKKLALVALTNFCCWFPVGILGFYSLQGYIFDREVYAWIAVFILPINSALNPIVYTIPALLSKCKK